MATIKVVRYHYKILQDGSSPIMLRISKGQGKSKYFSLGISATEKQFDDENECFYKNKKLTPSIKKRDENGKLIEFEGFEVKNIQIDRKRIRAREIIEDFERNDVDWTLKMFEDKFLNEKKKALVLEYLDSYVAKLEKDGYEGSSDKYRQLSLILRCFENDIKEKINKFYFHDFDYKVVTKFILYLEKKRKVKSNTIHFYLRHLRSIMNRAIDDGCGSKEAYCFSNVYDKSNIKKIIHINEYKKTTRKRYLPQDYLSMIKNTVFDKPHLEYARRFFLLSFYMYGCSYIDMALLKKSNINQAVTNKGMFVCNIEFIRRKTKKEYVIQIRPEIQEQLDWFNDNYVPIEDYLIPCITKEQLEGRELYNHIKNRRDRYTKHLKEIAKELNFPEAISDITSYFSRHSFAMAMRKKGEPLEVIQETLGHEDPDTTKVYLDGFDSDFLAERSTGLIE